MLDSPPTHILVCGKRQMTKNDRNRQRESEKQERMCHGKGERERKTEEVGR
jgi:hypothetical protein